MDKMKQSLENQKQIRDFQCNRPSHDSAYRQNQRSGRTGHKRLSLYLDPKCEFPLDNGEYESYTTLYRQGEG